MLCCSILEIKHISEVLFKSEMFSVPTYVLVDFANGTLHHLIIKQVDVLKVNQLQSLVSETHLNFMIIYTWLLPDYLDMA